jgi:hypothetical protein
MMALHSKRALAIFIVGFSCFPHLLQANSVMVLIMIAKFLILFPTPIIICFIAPYKPEHEEKNITLWKPLQGEKET